MAVFDCLEGPFIWFLKGRTMGFMPHKKYLACCKFWGTEVGEGPCRDVGTATQPLVPDLAVFLDSYMVFDTGGLHHQSCDGSSCP